MNDKVDLNRARNELPYFIELITGNKLDAYQKRIVEMMVNGQKDKSRFIASISLMPRKIR